jgi:uncharacterized membrane protein YhaH (DUF805 family)
MKPLIIVGRLVFGAWMLASGINHFFVSFFPAPTGHEPLAVLLMTALVHSRLIDVAMAIQLATGALILAGIFVPLALCVVMPISVCAVYWSVILEHRPVGALLALVAFALNGLLMLAYIDYYTGALQRWAATLGEREDGAGSYEAVFANPNGRTSRADYIAALLPLIAAAALYFFLVRNRNGEWVLATLLYPAAVLLARRLHDMGYTAWLLLIPGVLDVAALWLHLGHLKLELQPTLALAALIVSVVFIVWALIGRGQAAVSSAASTAR